MLSSNCKKKYYKVVIDGAKLLGEPVKHDERTHDNIQRLKMVMEIIIQPLAC